MLNFLKLFHPSSWRTSSIHIILIIVLVAISWTTLAVKKKESGTSQNPWKKGHGNVLKNIQNSNTGIQKGPIIPKKPVGDQYSYQRIQKMTPESHANYNFPKGVYKISVDEKTNWKGDRPPGSFHRRTRTHGLEPTEKFSGDRTLKSVQNGGQESLNGWVAGGRKTHGSTIYKGDGKKEGIRIDFQKEQGSVAAGAKSNYANLQMQLNRQGQFSHLSQKPYSTVAQVNMPMGMMNKGPHAIDSSLRRSLTTGQKVNIFQQKQPFSLPSNNNNYPQQRQQQRILGPRY